MMKWERVSIQFINGNTCEVEMQHNWSDILIAMRIDWIIYQNGPVTGLVNARNIAIIYPIIEKSDE